MRAPRPAPRPSVARLLAAWLFVTGVLSAGCQKLFGDFEIAEEASIVTSSTLCSAGSARCVGPWLYTCSDSEDTWLESQACVTAAHCSSRQGQCRACVPETHRCNGNRLEVCGADGSWALVEVCASEDACNLNSDSCRPCTVGEFQCNQASLLQCTQDQEWVQTQVCNNVAACVVQENRMSAECRPPVCNTKGAHQCNGKQLLRCTQAQDRLVEVDNCQSAELCDAAAADAQVSQGMLGTCLTRCAPGSLRCTGASLETCNAEGTRWEPTATCTGPEQCSVSAGGCQPCAADTFECNDAELRRCLPTSPPTWETVQNCGNAELCNAATKSCTAAGCPVANQAACLPTGLHRCPPDQSDWTLLTVCQGDLCNANDQGCDTAACAFGQTRCQGNEFQRCRDDQRRWTLVEQCSDSETCGLEGCQATACEAGSFRCNDVYLEVCDTTGWRRADRCATRELCDSSAGSCRPPYCGGTLGDFNCLGTGLQRCLADRTGWDDIGDCSEDGSTCDASTGTCR